MLPTASMHGHCLCWNARQLTMDCANDRGGARASKGAACCKLDFLQLQINWFDPWLVAIMEISGGLRQVQALKA